MGGLKLKQVFMEGNAWRLYIPDPLTEVCPVHCLECLSLSGLFLLHFLCISRKVISGFSSNLYFSTFFAAFFSVLPWLMGCMLSSFWNFGPGTLWRCSLPHVFLGGSFRALPWFWNVGYQYSKDCQTIYPVSLFTLRCLGTARPKQSVRVTLELYTFASSTSMEAIRIKNRSTHKKSTIFQEDRIVTNASPASSSETEF